MAEETKQEATQKTEGQKEQAKTYTQAEVDALLQKEGDRRVTDALKKQEAKNAEKVREAQKLAAMNEQQKYEYELEQREKAIAEKEQALALAENKATASKILAEKSISQELVEFVVVGDAEEMNRRIKALEKAFKASVEAEVKKRIGGKAPEKSSTDPATLSKEAFRKMSLAEQQKLFNENPDVYRSLTS